MAKAPWHGEFVDLYKTFEGVVQDEEAFRNELERYSVWVDGKPQVRPRDVPPLVSQHLPYLRPTARNKMFNAELVVKRTPGLGSEPNAWTNDPTKSRENYWALADVASQAALSVSLPTDDGGHFEAFIGLVSHAKVVASMEARIWLFDGYWRADLAYFREALADQEILDWLVVMPQPGGKERLSELPGIGRRQLFKRARRPERGQVFGFISEGRHRPTVQFIATGEPVVEELRAYRQEHRGGMLLYPSYTSADPPQDAEIETQIVLAPYFVPPSTARQINRTFVQFRVRDPSRSPEP